MSVLFLKCNSRLSQSSNILSDVCTKESHLVADFLRTTFGSSYNYSWILFKIPLSFGLLLNHAVIWFIKNSISFGIKFFTASWAAKWAPWQIQCISYKYGHFSLILDKTEFFFPLITFAPSEANPIKFSHGIAFF